MESLRRKTRRMVDFSDSGSKTKQSTQGDEASHLGNEQNACFIVELPFV